MTNKCSECGLNDQHKLDCQCKAALHCKEVLQFESTWVYEVPSDEELEKYFASDKFQEIYKQQMKTWEYTPIDVEFTN